MAGKDKIVVLKSVQGKVEEKKIIDGDVYEVVRETAKKALEEWEPAFNDFIIVRDKYEVTLKLPLKPEEFEKYSRFGLRKAGSDQAVFSVPVFLISYENEWREDNYVDKKVYLVSIYVNDDILGEMEEWVAEATKIS